MDPKTNEVVAALPVGTGPADGALGPDGLEWIPNLLDNRVSRIDPATNRVVDAIPVGSRPFVLRVGFGDVWVASFGSNDVWRLHP